jgi:DNA-directed RNA polymerase subunit alpha
MPNFNIPESYSINEENSTEFSKEFVISPLERGYGITMGNALRRVLLSSVPGAAIVSIRVENALHEFQALEGVVEDLTDVVLNFKGVSFKLLESKPEKVNVSIKGPHVFTAGDIGDGNTQFEVLNPDLHIATVNEGAELNIEIRISRGRGYVPAEGNQLPDFPIGTIFIDSIFSPILNVSFDVKTIQGAEGEYQESLNMTVTTDGSLTPEEAMAYASKMIVGHVKMFIKEDTSLISEPVSEVDEEMLRVRNELKRSIDELELSVRSYNCLQAAEIKYIHDLVDKEESEMLRFKNFGRKSLTELNEKLSELGLHFGMDVDKYLKDEVN